MTENEAIKELHGIRPRGSIIPQKRAEALDVAIQVLEEVQQYRAIGTPEECLKNKDFLRFLANSMNQKKYETYLRIYNAVEKEGRDEQ